jgi:hypothetical protein
MTYSMVGLSLSTQTNAKSYSLPDTGTVDVDQIDLCDVDNVVATISFRILFPPRYA